MTIIINQYLLIFWYIHSLILDIGWEKIARFDVGANSNAYREQRDNLNEQSDNGVRKTTKCVSLRMEPD